MRKRGHHFLIGAEKKTKKEVAGLRIATLEKLAVEPDAGVIPVPVRGCDGNPQILGCLIDAQARKITELNQLRSDGVQLS